MRRSFPVLQNKLWPLVAELTEKHGAPQVFQELVIYVDDEWRTRVTIRPTVLKVSWRQPDSTAPYAEYGHRPNGYTTSTDNLKEKLLHCIRNPTAKCQISETPVFEFKLRDERTKIGVRNATLIGPLLTVEVADAGVGEDDRENTISRIRYSFEDTLGGDLPSLIDEVSRFSESCFLVQELLLLCPKIADYCSRNGIVNPRGKAYTYREIQENANNDYSLQEQVFAITSGIELLETNPTHREQHPTQQVSFIIPAFNAETSIKTTLQSIAGQQQIESFGDSLEVVIVDDASETPVSEVLRGCNYPFVVKVVRLETNSGASHARQIGFRHCSGDVLMFIDADVILSESYLIDHYIRNVTLGESVFVSFKRNIEPHEFEAISDKEPVSVECPDYSRDLRLYKKVDRHSVGVYNVETEHEVDILESTNFFKSFHGSRIFGVYDLASMVVGHNFTSRRDAIERMNPFTSKLKGWGMEDVYFGLRAITSGCFIIPVLSCGLLNLEHPPRSGSEEKKKAEYAHNAQLVEDLMNMPADQVL